MAKIIEEVAVRIGADTRELGKGMKKADRGVKQLIGGFKKLAGVLGIAFGGRALIRGFTRTLDVTNKLIKTAKGVGFLASEFQELTFAMNQVGVRSHSAVIALGDFQKRLGKAVAGTSPQFAKAFKDAGLDPKSLSKLDPAEAFDVALNRLASLQGDPRLAGLTGAVFEEQSGKDVLKIIRQWGAFTEARAKHARRVGKLDEEQQIRIEFLSEEVGVYSAKWDVMKQKFVAGTVPAILRGLDSLEEHGWLDAWEKGLETFFPRMEEGLKQLEKDLIPAADWLIGVKKQLVEVPTTVARIASGDGAVGAAYEFAKGVGPGSGASPFGPGQVAANAAYRRSQEAFASRMSIDVSVDGVSKVDRDLAIMIAVEVEKNMEKNKAKDRRSH